MPPTKPNDNGTIGHLPIPADTSATATPVVKSPFRWKWVLYLVAIILLFIAVRFLPLPELLRQTLEAIAALGPWAPVIFVVIYVVAAVFMIPGSVLTLGAGAVFGLAQGIIVVSIASTLAATCAFIIGRHLARDAVARRIQDNQRFAAVDQAVAAEGWKIVLLIRLSPAFPYSLMNYLFGLTRIKLGHYVLASWIGMLPGAAMYVYLGSLANVALRSRTPAEWTLYGVGLLATVAVTILVTRIARRALARRIEA